MSDREEPNEETGPATAAAPATEDTPAVEASLAVAGEAVVVTSAPVAGEGVVAASAPVVGEAVAEAPPPGSPVDGTVIESVVVVPAAAETATAEPVAPRRKGKPAKPSTLQPLPPYAIIETGGKQYRVSVGDVVSVEKLPVEAGSTITFDRVLLLSGDGETRVGTPTVAGASVAATVEETYRGEKLIIFKFKAKKGYRRKTGHRQSLTRLAITAITA